MKIIFADSFYWIALLSPKDTWHSRVIEWSQSYPDVSLVPMVLLTKFLPISLNRGTSYAAKL